MDPAEPNPLPASQYDPEPIQSAASIKPESKLVRALKNISPFTYCFAAVLVISLVALAYFVLQNLSLKSQLGMISFKWPWTSATCTYQGTEFKPGESVPSVDGCNSCSCSQDGQVMCTLMACGVTEQVVQNNTDSWQSYSNKTYQYSFKYPPDWQINYGKTAGKVIASSDDVAEAANVSLFKPELSNINRPDGKVMGIDIVFNSDVISPLTEEVITCEVIDSPECIEKLRYTLGTESKIEKMSLGSHEAISVESPAKDDSFSSKNVYFLNQGKVFEISLITNNMPMDKALLNTFAEILNTLSFSPPKSSESTETTGDDLPTATIKYSPKSDWQTYTDDLANYEIQFEPTSKVHEYPGATVMGESLSVTACRFKDPQGKEVCLTDYSIRVFNNYTGGSRRDWLQENLNAYKPYYMHWIIDGKNALVAIDGNPGGSSSLNILIPNGNQMIVFMVSGVAWDPDTGKVPDLAYEKSVLSTFKTID